MKKLQGKVTSLKTANTATVSVERKWAHPLYQKLVRRSKKYACDFDAKLIELVLNDVVEIQETRPLSKTKRFKVVKKIGK
jgi:small subunit ribosomal protein S17